MTAIATGLTAAERDLLAHAEEKIERGLETFFEVGQALVTVRDNRLYREQYGTFEEYCEERWGFTARRANQFVDATAVLKLISGTTVPEINSDAPNESTETEGAEHTPDADPVVPANEAQVRPLAPLLPEPDAAPEEKAAAEEEIKDAWREAANAAPRDSNGKPKVTSRHVEDAVAKRTAAKAASNGAKPRAGGTPKTQPKKERRRPIPDAFHDAVYELRKSVEKVERIVLDDRWPKNAAKVAPGDRNDLRGALDLLTAVVEQANQTTT